MIEFVAEEMRRPPRVALREFDGGFLLRLARPRALLLHQFFETLGVHREPALTGHQLREVEWKTLLVIEPKRELAAYFADALPEFRFKERDAFIERAVEGFLLALDRLLDDLLFRLQLRKHTTHRTHQDVD